VAGAARMSYRRFFAYDVCGGVLWVMTTVLGGYFLGSMIPNVEHEIHWVILVVVVVSLIPPVLHVLRQRRGKPAGPVPDAQPEE
jgi:membrane-associated protein